MLSRKTVLRIGAIALIFVVAGTFSLMNQAPAYAGVNPYIGEIIMFGGNFAIRNYAFCDGQLISISQNPALFSILGTTYGGDGRTTFALPDMRGRAPVHEGQGAGLLSYRSLGQRFGGETHTMAVAEMPNHTHSIATTATATLRADGSADDTGTEKDPGGNSLGYGREKIYSTGAAGTAMHSSSIDLSVGVTIGNTGGNVPIQLSQPSIVVSFMMAVQGTFPPRN